MARAATTGARDTADQPQTHPAGDRPDGQSSPDTVITLPDPMRTTSTPAPDIVIDLTGAPASRRVSTDHDGSTDRGGGAEVSRYRPMLVVLATAAVVFGVLAATNFAIGMQWRSQALAERDRAARAAADAAAQQHAVVQARADRDAADLRRDAMAQQLAVSETDVAALEARLSALANDRARAEDYGDYADLTDSPARLRTLRAQVDSCVAQVAALRTALVVGDLRATALQRMASAAEATCEQIGADVAVLAADE